MFGEALIDPILTLCKDILPRFIKTDIYAEFKKRQLECCSLPPANTLVVPPPAVDFTGYSEERDMTEGKRFSLAELLREGFLFCEFLDFLQRRVCAECLYCYRMVSIYEEKVLSKDVDTKELAWTIYKYFVAVGSSCEVSCPAMVRNEIMRNMASPTADMFILLKKSAYDQLTTYLTQYSQTTEYKNLGITLREKFERVKEEGMKKTYTMNPLPAINFTFQSLKAGGAKMVSKIPMSAK